MKWLSKGKLRSRRDHRYTHNSNTIIESISLKPKKAGVDLGARGLGPGDGDVGSSRVSHIHTLRVETGHKRVLQVPRMS